MITDRLRRAYQGLVPKVMPDRTIGLLSGVTGHDLLPHGVGARCTRCGVEVIEGDGPDTWTSEDGRRVTHEPPPCR